MIDINTETLLTPDEARRQIPGRKGKQLDLCTLYRWMQLGRKGVRLEYVCLSRKQYTSKEALARFFQRFTEAAEAEKIEAAKKAGKPIAPFPAGPSSRQTRRPPDRAWPAGPNRPDAPAPTERPYLVHDRAGGRRMAEGRNGTADSHPLATLAGRADRRRLGAQDRGLLPRLVVNAWPGLRVYTSVWTRTHYQNRLALLGRPSGRSGPGPTPSCSTWPGRSVTN